MPKSSHTITPALNWSVQQHKIISRSPQSCSFPLFSFKEKRPPEAKTFFKEESDIKNTRNYVSYRILLIHYFQEPAVAIFRAKRPGTRTSGTPGAFRNVRGTGRAARRHAPGIRMHQAECAGCGGMHRAFARRDVAGSAFELGNAAVQDHA